MPNSAEQHRSLGVPQDDNRAAATVVEPSAFTVLESDSVPVTLSRSFRSDRLSKCHVLAALGMVLIGVMATRDAWHDIYTLAYNDEKYSHIFLVPIVSLAMVYVRRMRMRHCKPSGAILGVMLVAIGWAA